MIIIVSEKEEIKSNNIVKQYKKIIKLDDVIKEETKEYSPNKPQIPDYPYSILTVRGSRSRKINLLFNLISQQLNIDKTYLFAKDPYKAKD